MEESMNEFCDEGRKGKLVNNESQFGLKGGLLKSYKSVNFF